MTPQDLMHPVGSEPNTPFRRQVQRFIRHWDARAREFSQQVELKIPGRVIHLEKQKKKKKNHNKGRSKEEAMKSNNSNNGSDGKYAMLLLL